MATLTLNSIQQHEIGAGQNATPPQAPPSVGQSAVESVAAPATDTVSLSLAAQPKKTPSEPTTTLTETEANDAALGLRHQLASQNLSVTARQNQAIVSLLRR